MSRPARKVCPRCRIDKAREMFSVRRSAADGLQSYCKVCHIQRVRESCWKRVQRDMERAA